MKSKKKIIGKGVGICPGLAWGRIYLVKPDAYKQPRFNDPYVVVSSFSTPMLSMIIARSQGIITEQGGRTSHAAIIAREFGIPFIVLKEATKILKKIKYISFDGNVGAIYEEK